MQDVFLHKKNSKNTQIETLTLWIGGFAATITVIFFAANDLAPNSEVIDTDNLRIPTLINPQEGLPVFQNKHSL